MSRLNASLTALKPMPPGVSSRVVPVRALSGANGFAHGNATFSKFGPFYRGALNHEITHLSFLAVYSAPARPDRIARRYRDLIGGVDRMASALFFMTN